MLVQLLYGFSSRLQFIYPKCFVLSSWVYDIFLCTAFEFAAVLILPVFVVIVFDDEVVFHLFGDCLSDM